MNNFTNFSQIDVNLSYVEYHGAMQSSLNIHDMIRESCALIDMNILNAVCFLLLMWVIYKQVTPISKFTFFDSYPDYKDIFNIIFERFESLTETIALGFSIYIVYIAITQVGFNGLPTLGKTILIIAGCLSGLCMFNNIAEHLKKKKQKVKRLN